MHSPPFSFDLTTFTFNKRGENSYIHDPIPSDSPDLFKLMSPGDWEPSAPSEGPSNPNFITNT